MSLAEVSELRHRRLTDDVLEIGALTTHHELATDRAIARRLPALPRLFGRIGNIRVRMAGTVGGNLAHADPAQDPVVLMTVLGATAQLVGPDGEHDVPVQHLADGPFSPTFGHHELLTGFRVPLPGADASASYVKFLSGTQDDYATVSAACHLRLDGTVVGEASLAAGAVGPTVVELEAAAQALVGQRVEPDVLAEVERLAAESVSPSADRRGGRDYKAAMTGVVARRAVEDAVASAAPSVER